MLKDLLLAKPKSRIPKFCPEFCWFFFAEFVRQFEKIACKAAERLQYFKKVPVLMFFLLFSSNERLSNPKKNWWWVLGWKTFRRERRIFFTNSEELESRSTQETLGVNLNPKTWVIMDTRFLFVPFFCQNVCFGVSESWHFPFLQKRLFGHERLVLNIGERRVLVLWETSGFLKDAFLGFRGWWWGRRIYTKHFLLPGVLINGNWC